MQEKFKQIIGIQVCKATGIEIGELRKLNKGYENDFIPKYVLSEDGKIKNSEHYLCYSEFDETEFTLFDVVYSDSFIGNMISDCGIEEIFEKYDLNKILCNFNFIHTSLENWNRSIPPTERIVVDVIYSSNFNGETTEYDSEVELVGYLDEELILIYYENYEI